MEINVRIIWTPPKSSLPGWSTLCDSFCRRHNDALCIFFSSRKSYSMVMYVLQYALWDEGFALQLEASLCKSNVTRILSHLVPIKFLIVWEKWLTILYLSVVIKIFVKKEGWGFYPKIWERWEFLLGAPFESHFFFFTSTDSSTFLNFKKLYYLRCVMLMWCILRPGHSLRHGLCCHFPIQYLFVDAFRETAW